MTIEKLTDEKITADADAALAMERARGVPIGKDKLTESIFKIGFAAGAQWANQMYRELLK
jgi:hypothetical protein